MFPLLTCNLFNSVVFVALFYVLVLSHYSLSVTVEIVFLNI